MFLSESCRGKAVLHYFNFCIIEQFWNIILHEKTHEIAGKLIASLPGCMKQIFEMKEKPFTSSLNIWGWGRCVVS
jgi:hypothetical protein